MAHRPSSPRGSLRGGPGDAPDGDPPGDRSRGKGSRPRRARTRSPEEKRHRILAAAQELFRERGYGEVTAAEIAREAEVSEGIVFHHFGSKRGVLAAVSAAYGADLARAMFAGILPGGSPDVRDIIERVFDFVEANGNLHQLLVLVQDPADWNEALQSNRAVIIAALA
ncbi:MAG TPA: TetR/AcrR family transcriptional regulator, partial [Polyangiaceae bacterium LLY-WYZ-14_1]|nr:TetR/AcrR family transcriptional regulator [Polyangiaceae bacterium LLY-WYZ-14_1]